MISPYYLLVVASSSTVAVLVVRKGAKPVKILLQEILKGQLAVQ